MTRFLMTACTDIGLVRSNNEDSFIVNPDLSQNEWFIPSEHQNSILLGEDGCIMVVADGMGGANAGEVASDIAIQSIRHQYIETDLSQIRNSGNDSIKNFIINAIIKADSEIKHHAKIEKTCSGMGTTIVLAWIIEDVAHIGWCGDSRAYVFNKVSGLMRLSKDHSFVQELVDTGVLDEDLAFDHPQNNIITRCLSDNKIKAKPDYKCFYLSPEDTVLLCSDGLSGYCRDEEIMEVMQESNENIYDCRNKLIKHALDAGGNDNVTVALFKYIEKENENVSQDYLDTCKIGIPTKKDTELIDAVCLKGKKRMHWFYMSIIVFVITFILLISFLDLDTNRLFSAYIDRLVDLIKERCQ